ncbi:MAG: hypothetical protein AAFM91_13710 [Pseudomonadota bacterium]
MRSSIAGTIVALGAFASSGLAYAQSDEWTYYLTPYLWLPTIDGTINYDAPSDGTGGPSVAIGPADWLELLSFGLLLEGEARKGRLSLHGDFIYLSLESDNDGRVRSVEGSVSGPGGRISVPVSGQLNLDTNIQITGLLLTGGVGYAYRETESSSHVVYAGARYLNAEADTNWNLSAEITAPGGGLLLPAQGSRDDDADFLDGIVGLRGKFRLGNGAWSLPYNFDVGTGSSDLVWNATVTLQYDFDWGALVFGYRHLEYSRNDEDLLEDFSLSGPGFGFRFGF